MRVQGWWILNKEATAQPQSAAVCSDVNVGEIRCNRIVVASSTEASRPSRTVRIVDGEMGNDLYPGVRKESKH